jgi:tetratricopeptide (TPR) repeat protein
MALHFITAVWGAGHTAVFLDIGLPSLLAPGNFPGMADLANARFHLFTKKSDFARIEASPAYRKLRDIMMIELDFIEEEFEVATHTMMSECHRAGLKRACERGAYAAFMTPECVWSDHSIANLERIAATGVAVVYMPGLRLIKESAGAALSENWLSADRSTMTIPARDLVRIGFDHLHPITADLFYREHGRMLMPANLLWTVAGQGVLAHCFHLHPILIEPNAANIDFQSTIDEDLGLVSDPAGLRDYIVTDSDEAFAYELSPLSHNVQTDFRKGSPAEVAAWAEVSANARHRLLVHHALRLHYAEIDPAAWVATEQEARQVLDATFTLLASSQWGLLKRRLWRNLECRERAAVYRERAAVIRVLPLPPRIPVRSVDLKRLQAEADTAANAGAFEEALRLYQELITHNPSGVEGYCHRSQLLLKLNRPEEALHDANLLSIIEPQNNDFYRINIEARHQARMSRYAHAPQSGGPTITPKAPLLRPRYYEDWFLYSRDKVTLYTRVHTAKGLADLNRFFSWMFGGEGKLRPWHWRWSYETYVLQPLAKRLRDDGKRALLVRNDGVDISFASLERIENLESAALNQALLLLKAHAYGHIILARGRMLLEYPEIADALRDILATQQTLDLTVLDNGLTNADIARAFRPDVAIRDQAAYGSSGTAIVTSVVRRIRHQPFLMWIFARSSRGNLLRRCMMLFARFFVALITFPTLSASAALLNRVGSRSHHTAVTVALSRQTN